jgi:pimeloyl-ACP methyl ester carboxylesterase
MSSTPVAIDVDGHHITGIATESAVEHLPLVVALHGGSYTSAYFDVPGHSLLEAGGTNGFGVIALDRPCYGGSDPLPDGQVTFARNAEILDAAVAQLWKTQEGDRPGVVVIGHSIGAAIAVHLAARRPAWPLLGIALSGIHDKAPLHVINAWDSMPAGQPVVFTPDQRRMFFYGPDWTIEDDIVSRADFSAAPIPLAELLEVVGDWPHDAAGLAGKVRVPVQYVGVEFEQLWTISPDAVEEFAAYFTAAPLVDSCLMPGLGHDADHHRAGKALQLRQLAFALQCGEAVRRIVEEDAAPA